MPVSLQWILLAASVGLFVAAAACAVALLSGQAGRWRRLGRAAGVSGLITTSLLLAGHVWAQLATGRWVPFADNFEALVWVGVAVSGFSVYVQSRRAVAGLELVAAPVAAAALLGAGAVELWLPRQYDLRSTWVVVHRVASYSGVALFAVAAIGGVMYLHVSGRLRRHGVAPVLRGGFGSLERLEKWIARAVLGGFVLLTLGLVTGLARLDRPDELRLFLPKIAFASAVWVIYAFVLHVPVWPQLRGRTAAWLSVAGFILMVGAVAASQWVPTRGGTDVAGGVQ